MGYRYLNTSIRSIVKMSETFAALESVKNIATVAAKVRWMHPDKTHGIQILNISIRSMECHKKERDPGIIRGKPFAWVIIKYSYNN